MANIPISSFTAAANATGIGMSGFSLTGANAQSMLDLAGTWNTSGTPTGLKLNVTDTASNAASLLMDLQVGGVSRAYITKAGNLFMRGNTQNWLIDGNNVPNQLGFYANGVAAGFAVTASGGVAVNLSFAATVSSTPDLILTRDAANALAQRNGTNAQTLRVYNTFTDASNYERLSLSGNVTSFRIAGEALGTGASRSIVFDTAAGAGGIVFATGGTSRWAVSSSAGAGHFIASTDNTVDIGSNGANRPRDIFSSRDVYAQSNTSGFYLGSVSDVALLRDDANILAQRRSTNAQTFRVYNTSTDASNYERGVFDWINTPNALTIGTQQAGTGTARSMRLITQGDANLLFITNSVTRLDVSSAGLRATANLIWTTDNAFDIGASGANRPRSIFTSAGVVFANSLAVNSSTFHSMLWNAGQYGWASSSTVTTSSAIDTGLSRVAAGIIGVTNGSTGGGAMQMTEITAPAAPAADNVRIYAEDNGAGKTRLMARFATGAAVQIAIEP